ncbi:MAG: choice-of-anchor D domain-containing protein, partial [Planctomycetaceae bacterium]
PGGFPSDYITVNPGSEDILVDLGMDVPLSEISLWGYAADNGNGIREFTVDFATDAEGGEAGLGDEAYGASIALKPGFTALNDDSNRQTFAFGQVVVARYVRITAITNYFGIVIGGDRLGLGEVAFEVTTATVGPDIRVTADQALALAADVPTAFTVPVSNAGDADLVISGTSFTGANAGAFGVTGVTSPIGALGSGSVAVTFNPAGLGGPISATLHIQSNDADTPEATVMLTGTLPALEPDISVPAQVTLASDGMPETVDVVVSNVGQQALNLSGVVVTGANAGAFLVVTQPVSIVAGGMGTIQVSFDPAGLPGGAVDATLQITSNDPDSPLVNIPIVGGVAAEFYPIVSVTSATEGAGADFFPAVNLIQGPGVGFGSGWPHNALGEGQAFAWVTNAPNGGAGDYFSPLPTPSPVMVFDLGQDVALAEVSFWGYANTNANGANLFSLRFATSSDGPAGFGTSIPYNPTFAPTQPIEPRQSFLFDQPAFARYVEWVPLDNFFGINPPGGDRVGAGEIAFEVVPGAGGGFRIVEIVRNSP